MRTRVGIVGAGPAGLTLARLLEIAGVETVVLEARSREYCEGRIRAGVVEERNARLLANAGVAERLEREGIRHGGIHLQFAGERHHVGMRDLVGQGIVVYGQTEIVKDLIAARVASGLPLHFETPVHQVDPERGIVRFDAGELECDVIAGCDGFHGVCRDAIPDGVLETFERSYPFGWLGILARVPPSIDELVYAHHPDGFALLSLRSPTLSRYYLQVDPDEELLAWSDDRIWAELWRRTRIEGWELAEGPIIEKDVTRMRSFVSEPMQYGRLYLAGDAAHIVPPTGAKGLNLALADVDVLAEAIVAGPEALGSYSARCLARVWRAEHFSWFMTSTLHRLPGDDPFDTKLQLSQLRHLVTSEAAARDLAENYTGVALGS